MWDTASQELSLPAGIAGKLDRVDFSPTGRFLATTNYSGTMKLWDASSRKLIATFSEQLPRSETVAETIDSATVSPDGKTLAVIKSLTRLDDSEYPSKYSLKLWDADSSGEPVILTTHKPATFTSVREYPLKPAFSTDGRIFAYYENAGDFATVYLWDVASAKEEASFDSVSIRSIRAIAFSSNGSKLIVIGKNSAGSENAELWDVRSRKFIKMLAQWEYQLTYAFSPDNKVLAVASISDLGPAVTLWDVELVKPLATLRGYPEPVLCMTFSPDSKILATGSRDGLAKLWSAPSHRLLITLYDENKEPFNSIAFSPDNRMLITGGATGTVKLWPTLQ